MTIITVKQAAQAIKEGKIVGFPTETVYGLGADATNDSAVAQVFALKNRPTFNPLIVHYASVEAARTGAKFNALALKLAEVFWPGPLTLILPRYRPAGISLLVSAGLDTIGIRIPAHPVALELLNEVNCPIAAPSANRSGSLSPTCAQHVQQSFKDDNLLIVDGGPCSVGIESTIIDLSEEVPVLLRPGGISQEQLQKYVGAMAHRAEHDEEIRAPGQLESHYAPNLPVRLKATYVRPKEAFLGFGNCDFSEAIMSLNLSQRGDLVEAAANLFAYLHELDDPAYEGIAVAPIPEKGLGVAINDRLRRAAGERPIR